MTKPSESDLVENSTDDITDSSHEQSINKFVTQQLDSEVNDTSPKVESALSTIRSQALTKLNENSVDRRLKLTNRLQSWISLQKMAPIALAVCLAILVNYLNQPANDFGDVVVVQPIPAELFTAQIPTEDIALLQDLEFASWLSEYSDTTDIIEATNTQKELLL